MHVSSEYSNLGQSSVNCNPFDCQLFEVNIYRVIVYLVGLVHLLECFAPCIPEFDYIGASYRKENFNTYLLPGHCRLQ